MVIKLGNAVIRSALHRVPDSGAGGALDQPLDASSLVPRIWPKLPLSPNYWCWTWGQGTVYWREFSPVSPNSSIQPLIHHLSKGLPVGLRSPLDRSPCHCPLHDSLVSSRKERSIVSSGPCPECVCVWFVNNRAFYGSLRDFIKDAGAGALWDIRRDLSNKPQLRALECSKCLRDFLPFITEFYFTFIPVKSCVLLVEISWFRFPQVCLKATFYLWGCLARGRGSAASKFN